MNQPAPGWYPDPSGGGQRYWDGEKWGPIAPPSAPPTTQVIVKRSSAGRILLALVIGVPLFLLGSCALILGAMVHDSNEKATSSTRSSTPTEKSTSAALPGRPIPPSPGEAYKIGGFGNSWLAGIYEAPGAESGAVCRWVIQRDLVGDDSSIIDKGYGGPGESVRVGLRDGQYFTSEGCGTWVRVGRL